MQNIDTLGALKATDYRSKSIKDEIRDNLIQKIAAEEQVYEGIWGFEDTVLPDIERALLSRHSILLLGLRGQAKTRIARQTVQLLDEYIPIIAGSEIMDDPLRPISKYARHKIAEMGDDTPIAWVHRSERYVEKLATPDVSIADLLGDVDPIKAASLKLPYSDERVIHFGLIPRAHRSIFVINELPDLQARIQVALFNILQEGDLQIRGFKLRLPLDIAFMFTANPEDYTQRGSIITPLKDRIESQILTHYPQSIEIGKKITAQEIKRKNEQDTIRVPDMVSDLIERVVFEARISEYIDEKSGVSARLPIAAYENMLSSAERRMLINGEKTTDIRLTDLWAIIPAMTGKMELVYEGEQQGAYTVALTIIGAALEKTFLEYFPADVEDDTSDPYGALKLWFADGNMVRIGHDADQKAYETALQEVPGLQTVLQKAGIAQEDAMIFRELILHGLAEQQVVQKSYDHGYLSFGDSISDMMSELDE